MHPMFKNWNPRNQAQVNNTLRLAMAECPQDMPELIKIVKSKGFDVPSGLTPATGWGSFESKFRKKTCSMQKKIESLRKKNEEASLRFFEPIFYVADLRGNEIDSDYEYDDLEDAIDKARELSEENPDTPYTVSSMCNIPCLFNGELFEETEFYSQHHDFGYDEKLNTRARKRSVREQKGLKATVVGGELEGTYDVEDLWKYARGKTPPSSDGPMSRAILGNQPKLPGYLGPMWDGDGLRYETQEVYNQLSR